MLAIMSRGNLEQFHAKPVVLSGTVLQARLFIEARPQRCETLSRRAGGAARSADEVGEGRAKR